MFEYYYGNQTEQFNFVRVPWVLFTHGTFSCLSNDAKMLYALLLDRISLSRQNGWLDDENRVYIVYTVEEAADMLNCCGEKVSKLFRELDDEHGIGLITRKRRGQGKPSIIYVKNFIGEDGHDDVPQQSRSQDDVNVGVKNSDNTGSCTEGIRALDPDKTDAIKNNIIKTDFSHTEYQSYQSVGCERDDVTALVNDNIDYDILLQNNPAIANMITEIRDIMVDVICGDRQVIVGGNVIPADAAKSAYLKLSDEHILYVINCISKLEGKIQCPDKYICAALYNAAYTRNISLFAGFTVKTGMTITGD